MGSLADLGRLAVYPVLLLGRAALLAWLVMTVAVEFPPVLLAFAVGSFVLMLLAEAWIPYREDWRVRGDLQWQNDVGHSLAYTFVNGPILQVAFVAGVGALAGGDARLWRGVWPDGWPWLAQIALAMLLNDFFEYWLHRASHRTPWLWPLHVLHHTPDRLHVLKTLRHSWPYAGLRGLAIVLPLMLLGAPFAVLFFAPLATIVVGPLAHTNLAARLPRWMHRVFNTPDVHRIHHSIDPLEGNSNFCFVFPVWDIVFGTWTAPERATVKQTGIVDDRVPEGFWRQLALPLTLAPRDPDPRVSDR